MAGEFNPANALISVGHEAIEGVACAEAAWHDHKFVGETLSSEAPKIKSESIINASQQSEGAPTKIGTNGDINLELDAEGHLAYLVNVQGKNDTTEVAAGTVYEHRLAPSETANTAPRTLSTRVWRDDDNAHIFTGGRVQEMEITAEIRNFIKSKVTLFFQRAHYWAAAVAAVDPTPNSAVPQLRGLPSYANWNLANNTVKIKVTDVTGLPTAFIATAAIGAGAYGATTFTVNVGLDANGKPQWVEVVNGSGARIGSRDLPVDYFIESATGVEVNDEWTFDAERGVWTPDYPDVPIFNEIFTYLLLDGVQLCLKKATIKVVRPITPQECIGGRFPKSILTRGERLVTWDFEREYVDVSIRRRLERGEPFKMRMEAYSGEEFETGHEHQFIAVSPRLIAEGRTASVTSKTEANEKIVATAYPSPDDPDGFVDDITFLVKNSIADPNV